MTAAAEVPHPDEQEITASMEARFSELETIVEQGLENTRLALEEIRESRLYRIAGFAAFGDYCVDRWDMTRSYADRLIAWAKVERNLAPIGVTLPKKESQAREISDLDEALQREVWKEALDTAGDSLTAAHVRATRERLMGKPSPLAKKEKEEAKQKKKDDARKALHSSESNEWYTPPHLTDAAHTVMGNIDLDPASCTEANEWIKAGTIYTIEDDGLQQRWFGRVWTNPPFGLDEHNRSNQAVWSARLILEHTKGEVVEACMLTAAATGARWFQPLWEWPICFIEGRPKFQSPGDEKTKDQPTHFCCVTYIGPVEKWNDFERVFGEFGHVKVPERHHAAEFTEDFDACPSCGALAWVVYYTADMMGEARIRLMEPTGFSLEGIRGLSEESTRDTDCECGACGFNPDDPRGDEEE